MATGPDDWCPPDDTPPPALPGTPGVELTTQPGPESAPRLRPGLISQLCSYGWQPILITGCIRDMLVRQFQDGMIDMPELAQYVWKDDPPTGILIESIHRWRGELAEKRPAIVIKRNSYQNMRLGIANRVGTDERGQEVYSTAWIGSHTAFCIHRTGAGVELLTTQVQRHLTRFGPRMTRGLGLMRWEVTEVGTIAEVEEAKESFAVPITVGWAYLETWTLELESPILRRVSMSTVLQF